MKILLLKDVKKIGRRYEIKDVSDGFARNFLIPKKLAVPADEKATALKKEMEEREKSAVESYKKLAERLGQEVLEFKVKTGSKGEVFGSVSAEQIKKTLQERGYGEAEVKLEKPLRSLGENKVEVDFGRDIKGEAKIIIGSSRS